MTLLFCFECLTKTKEIMFEKVCSCSEEGVTMTKRAIDRIKRIKAVNAYKKEKEESNKLSNIVCIMLFGKKKEVSKDEYDNVYKTLGFKIID